MYRKLQTAALVAALAVSAVALGASSQDAATGDAALERIRQAQEQHRLEEFRQGLDELEAQYRKMRAEANRIDAPPEDILDLSVDILTETWYNLTSEEYRSYGIRALLSLVILIVGWFVAKIVQTVIRFLLHIVRFDVACDKIRLTGLLESVGLHNLPSATFANLIYWLLLLVVFTTAVQAIANISVFDQLRILLLYFPRAMLGLFVILVGVGIAALVSKIIHTATENAGIRFSKWINLFVFGSIVAFATVTAMKLLYIEGRWILQWFSYFVLFGLAGLALAFGFGGRYLAANMLAGWHLRKAYRKGQEVFFDAQKGIIKQIALYETSVYTDEGIVNIPNDIFAKKIIRQES